MCGRYGFSVKSDRDILDRFDVDAYEYELHTNYNAAPTQEMPIVERHSPNSLHLRHWGFQPAWANKMLINAQAEKLDISKVWSKAFRESRCIVPASYFFEWKRGKEINQPYLIKLKKEDIFGMAGLIMTYHDENKEEKKGFVIITTTPNSLMKDIHTRMPVILKREDEDAWLNPDNVEPEKLTKFLRPYPSSDMEAFPVSTLVNKPANNFPEITKPLSSK